MILWVHWLPSALWLHLRRMLQEVNTQAKEVPKIAKETAGKHVYSSGVHLSVFVSYGFGKENWMPFFSDSLHIRSICYPRFATDSKTLMMKYVEWGLGKRVTKFPLLSSPPPPAAPRNTFWLTNRSLGYATCISKSSAICKIRTLLFILPCSFSLMFRIGMEMSCYSLRIEWCKEVSATQTVGWQSNLGKSANSSFLITIHAAFLYRNNMHEGWKWIRESAYE